MSRHPSDEATSRSDVDCPAGYCAMSRHPIDEATKSEIDCPAGCRHTLLNIVHRTREAKALSIARCPVIRVTRQREVK